MGGKRGGAGPSFFFLFLFSSFPSFPSPAMQPARSATPMRLLIIDDEENIRRTTAVALEAMGHETAAASNAAAALKQLEQDQFDVAFLDLKLGDESGLELLPQLLKLNPQLEVVVFTAYASIE